MKKTITIIMLLALCSLLTINGCWLQEKDGDAELEVDETTVDEVVVEEEVAEEEEETVDVTVEEGVDALTEIIENEEATEEDCASIENEEIRDTCEQRFIYETAVETGDTSMCEQLTNEYDQESCVEEITTN